MWRVQRTTNIPPSDDVRGVVERSDVQTSDGFDTTLVTAIGFTLLYDTFESEVFHIGCFVGTLLHYSYIFERVWSANQMNPVETSSCPVMRIYDSQAPWAASFFAGKPTPPSKLQRPRRRTR